MTTQRRLLKMGDNGRQPQASTSPARAGNGHKGEQNGPEDVRAAKRGLLKAMWEASFIPRFSSKPIDMEDYFERENFKHQSSAISESAASRVSIGSTNSIRSSLVSSKNLTNSEQVFLETLLQSEDLDSIRKASVRLADKELFPPSAPSFESESEKRTVDSIESEGTKRERRSSAVQQGLYRLHESGSLRPSAALRRMSTLEKQRPSRSELPPLPRNNSITKPEEKPQQGNAMNTDGHTSWDMDSETDQPSMTDSKLLEEEGEEKPWNPFGDINSWIDGNQGVEVDGDGVPDIPAPTSNPFKILGTSADDVSAHPHVLTPPLMEGLQAFMPESLHEYHFWMKYSFVRDGPANRAHPDSSFHSPLQDMLRHCRASKHTVLAMETTDGHVFGAFCSQPWHLQAGDYYGNDDSFLWRMRHSRNKRCDSIVDQVLMESKIDVFPFTSLNTKIQKNLASGEIALGSGEVKEISGSEGDHFGHAILLDSSMRIASTSTSETFGNPSLVNTERRGEQVELANLEMWALTPHESIESAITLEMNQLFLAETQGPKDKNLNLFEILVGGTV